MLEDHEKLDVMLFDIQKDCMEHQNRTVIDTEMILCKAKKARKKERAIKKRIRSSMLSKSRKWWL